MGFHKLYLFFLTILLFCKTNSQNLEKPNFVFFLVDDLGYSDIGCYGSNYYKTPSIDKLAAEGAMFTNAYSS